MEEFDYVIVGAGAAGCVLANRLSESGKNTVAIVEAGSKDNHIWIKIPAGFPGDLSSALFRTAGLRPAHCRERGTPVPLMRC